MYHVIAHNLALSEFLLVVMFYALPNSLPSRLAISMRLYSLPGCLQVDRVIVLEVSNICFVWPGLSATLLPLDLDCRTMPPVDIADSVPYSERPEWSDLTPVAQYENIQPLAPIFYNPDC